MTTYLRDFICFSMVAPSVLLVSGFLFYFFRRILVRNEVA